MRRACAFAAVMIAVALAAGVDDASAQRMATTTMVARPDLAQLQAAALEWLRVTITSGQFMFGAALGVAIAEGGRFVWRWSMRTLGFVSAVLGMLMRHRLIAAGCTAVAGYVVYYAFFV